MTELIPIGAESAGKVLEIKNAAFYADFVKYGSCPGYGKTLEHVAAVLADEREKFLIKSDGVVCGYASVSRTDSGFHLDCLCVVPEFQNRGIGQAALSMLLTRYPVEAKWTLETPSDKRENHYFYGKFGFCPVSEFTDEGVKVNVFEKTNSL